MFLTGNNEHGYMVVHASLGTVLDSVPVQERWEKPPSFNDSLLERSFGGLQWQLATNFLPVQLYQQILKIK